MNIFKFWRQFTGERQHQKTHDAEWKAHYSGLELMKEHENLDRDISRRIELWTTHRVYINQQIEELNQLTIKLNEIQNKKQIKHNI